MSAHPAPASCRTAARSLVQSITLDDILGGSTRAPIRRVDLEAWLRAQGGVIAEDGASVLAFLDAVKGYRERFEQLPVDVRALSPPPGTGDVLMSFTPGGPAAPTPTVPLPPSLSARTWGLTSLFRTPMVPPALFTTGRPRGHSDVSQLDGRSVASAGESMSRSVASSTRPLIRRADTFASEASRTRSASLESFWEDGITDKTRENYQEEEDQPIAVLPMQSSLDAIFSRFLTRGTSPRPLHHLLPHALLATAQQAAARTTNPALLAPLDAALREWFAETIMPRFATAAVANLHAHTARGRLLCGAGIVLIGAVLAVLMLLDPSPLGKGVVRVPRTYRLLLLPMLLAGIGYALGSRASLCFWLALLGVRERVDYDALPQEDELEIRTTARPSIEKEPRPDDSPIRTPFDARPPLKSRLHRLLITAWRLTGLTYGLERVKDARVLSAQRRGVRRIVGVLLGVVAVCGVVLWFLPYIERGKEGSDAEA